MGNPVSPEYSRLLNQIETIVSKDSLTNPIEHSTLTPYANRLEAIALLVSHREEKAYSVFLDRVAAHTDIGSARDLDFYIFLNQAGFTPDIRPLENLFRAVRVINLQIPADEDIYIRPGEPLPNRLPPLGAKSGPNTFFFMAMKELSEKQTTLVLETDCYLGKNWLNQIREHCNRSGSFWVSGAPYSGPTVLPDSPGLLTHLNGVALYATGSKGFQVFLHCFKEFLVKLSPFMPEIAYDHGMRLFVDGGLRSGQKSSLWSFIDQQLQRTDLILNFSLPQDAWVDAAEIFKQTSCVILHKKSPLQSGGRLTPDSSRPFPLVSAWGILDCYIQGKHLFLDLDPRMWIEKSDAEILSFFEGSVFKGLKLKSPAVKRTLKYHVAIFLRVDQATFKNKEALLSRNMALPVREADASPAFLQVASVVSSLAEAQTIIDRWEKSSALPDRFVFYFLNSLTPEKEKELHSRSAVLVSYLWNLPKMHQVSNRAIFKEGEELDYLSVSINSAYSHCLKFHQGATWTVFVTPEDQLEPLSSTSKSVSLFSVLKDTPAEISTVNLPIRTAENRDKPLHLPVLRTSAHVFTACLNWAYAKPEEQRVDLHFEIFRGVSENKIRVLIRLPSSNENETLKDCLLNLKSPLQANQNLKLEVVGAPLKAREELRNLKIHWRSAEPSQYSAFNLPFLEPCDVLLLASDQITQASSDLYQIITAAFKKFFPNFDGVIAFRHPEQINRLVIALGWNFIKTRGFVFNPHLRSNFGLETLLEDAQKVGKLKNILAPIFVLQDPTMVFLDSSNLNRLADACHDKAVLDQKTPLDKVLSSAEGPFKLTKLNPEEALTLLADSLNEFASTPIPELLHSFQNLPGALQWNRHRFQQIHTFQKMGSAESGVFFKLKMKFLVLLYFGGHWDEWGEQMKSPIPGLLLQATSRKRAGASTIRVGAATPGHPILGFMLGELFNQRKHLAANISFGQLETLVINRALHKLEKWASNRLFLPACFAFSDEFPHLNTRNRNIKNLA